MNNHFPEITLRTATIADLQLLVFWDSQQHVIDSDPNDDWNWEVELTRDVSWREQLIAEVSDRPIGFVQIIDPLREESHYWGDVEENLRAIDIWIGEADFLGKGFGTAIMRLALNRCFDNPNVTAVIIDPLESNTRAHRFYESLGFRFTEKKLLGSDQCFVFRLNRTDWVKNEN